MPHPKKNDVKHLAKSWMRRTAASFYFRASDVIQPCRVVANGHDAKRENRTKDSPAIFLVQFQMGACMHAADVCIGRPSLIGNDTCSLTGAHMSFLEQASVVDSALEKKVA